MNERLIKILIVDDSFFMRNVLTRILSEIPGFSVIGTASDGVDFLRKMETLDPDVITLDIEMPKMDGLTALGQLMPKKPKPVVILSSLAEEGAEATIRALQLGAVDFLLKPSGAVSLDIGKVKEELANKIRMAAGIKMRPVTETRVSRPAVESAIGDKHGRHLKDSDRVVLIGSSTGGPKALMELVPHLSRDMDAAFLLVQHMPSGFTQSLAARINQASSLEVREARHGDEIQGGVALLAPGDQHMVVAEEKGRKVVHLNNEPRVWGVRPSVDITINSAVPFFKERLVGVILTGMGTDGAKGISIIKKNGGKAIAQDEESSIVYGMPKAAFETGCLDKVLPLSEVAAGISSMVRGKEIR